jgi:hypothetical protein
MFLLYFTWEVYLKVDDFPNQIIVNDFNTLLLTIDTLSKQSQQENIRSKFPYIPYRPSLML